MAALLLAALPACGRSAEAPAETVDNASNAAAAAPEVAPPGNAAAGLPANACATPRQVELDAASFAREDAEPFPPERLEAFKRSAAAAFGAAAEAACAAGEIEPSRLATIRRLLLQSASGATETAFYEDAESAGAGTLVFQYVFVEEDLAVPGHADIRQGLSCWADPERPACAEREP
ncbi:MAG TPA: hypothetical protein VF704_08065 [Allosphingosinicella sp.]|jgi:hypothetical protein